MPSEIPVQKAPVQANEVKTPAGPAGVVRLLGTVETAVYVAVAVLLTGAIAHSILSVLAHAAQALLQKQAPPFFQMLDEVLLILMLVEIIHTVRVSLSTRSLNIEPFLLVGLIASVRRLLVITLEQSSLALDNPQLFNMLLIELGVMAGVIFLLVVGIWLLRGRKSEETPRS